MDLVFNPLVLWDATLSRGGFLDTAMESAVPLGSEAIVAQLSIKHAMLAFRTVGIKLLLRF